MQVVRKSKDEEYVSADLWLVLDRKSFHEAFTLPYVTCIQKTTSIYAVVLCVSIRVPKSAYPLRPDVTACFYDVSTGHPIRDPRADCIPASHDHRNLTTYPLLHTPHPDKHPKHAQAMLSF